MRRPWPQALQSSALRLPTRQDSRRCVAVLLWAIAVAAWAVAPGVAAAEVTTPEVKSRIEAAGLIPWTFRSNPTFEFPDSSGKVRSLTTDFKGQVVLIYMLAEW